MNRRTAITLSTSGAFVVSSLQVSKLLTASGRPVSEQAFMSDDEEFRQLRQQIYDGIERVRRSIRRAKRLLLSIGQTAPRTFARGLGNAVDNERKSNTA
jgi:hypothetical protein